MQCARCSAQNPDGNVYCQTCGTPLAAPAAVATAPTGFTGPPPGMAPPTFGAPGQQQSPYYYPPGVIAPAHRTPWMLIVAGVVALVVLMAGFGTAFAVLASRGSSNGSAGTSLGDLPSPTPAITPSPVASPTSTPVGSGGTVSNGGLSLRLPSGWSVASQDNESIVLADAGGQGSISLGSGPSVPAQTAQDNKATIDGYFKSKYPDVRACPNTAAQNTSFNGAPGISWTLCFTLTSGSSAIPAAASLFAGANQSGSVYYAVMVLTRQDNLTNYLSVSKPVLQGVVWKLS